MSRADDFDDEPIGGFTRRYDAQAAPLRQLRVSICLVLVLALATLLVGLLARPDNDFAPTSARLLRAWSARAL